MSMKKRKELSVEQLQSMVMNGRLKKFVSIEEGALLYSVGKNSLQKLEIKKNAFRQTGLKHSRDLRRFYLRRKQNVLFMERK